ncbi:MAG: M23 family metallopeptidase, partial [Hymenobacter sp.]
VVNKPVYASADGYISRLKQSSFGYGNVLYITHPNGLTTVYGHLNKFEGAVGAELLRQQYEKQTYELELFFDKGQFPVRRGEEVALSGNTGGSAGPHVHWEVRDAQDRQLNPLQWGGFSEIQDHTGPTLQALAVEPLAIGSRVRGRFERALLVPKLQPAPGAATVWPDTVTCFGPVGLLLQGFDRFDGAWNKNGIQRVTVRVNGQPHYQHVIDAVPFPSGTRQVNNFVDFAYARTAGRTLQKLWVDEGNDLPFYTPPGLGQGKLDVEDGKVYSIDFELADAYNNKATAHLVLKGEKPLDYAKLPGAAASAAAKPKLSYDITRNLLRATVLNAPADTAGLPAQLLLRRGGRQLALRPSYSVGAATTYLYDLRAGLPDSLLLGGVR